VREVYDAHGLDFYRKVRSRRGEIRTAGQPPLIQTLEQIAPGFLAWETKYHAGVVQERQEAPKQR
jgi:hypothetical protein